MTPYISSKKLVVGELVVRKMYPTDIIIIAKIGFSTAGILGYNPTNKDFLH